MKKITILGFSTFCRQNSTIKELQWFKVGILVTAVTFSFMYNLTTPGAGIRLIMISCILNCGDSKLRHPNNCIITPQ